MKTIQDIAQITEELLRWQGAEAVVWQYQATHGRLQLLLSRPGEPEGLLVAALGCSRISGPLKWRNASVVLESSPDAGLMALRDGGADFEVQFLSLVAALVTKDDELPSLDDDALNQTITDEDV